MSISLNVEQLCSQHQRFYRYWEQSAPPGILPGRQHFDPLDIPDLMPWVIMFNVNRKQAAIRFQFRLVGTGVVERYGRDMTGKFFEEAYRDETLERQIKTYTEVAVTANPSSTRQKVPVADKEFVDYERLILPMASDGQTVDLLIALMAFDNSSE